MSPESGRPPWRGADTVALLAVTAAAGIVRFWRITVPDRIVFDEVYYAHDACVFVKPAACGGIAEAFSEEHPLLGKWIVSVGIRAFGYEPFGWRVMPAVAGTAAIALTFLLGWRLLRSTVAATLAAGLLAVDGLHFVLSRTAMLDVFVSTFSLATILFVSIDRDREGGRERLRDRPWLIAAGLAGGAAAATKWSGIPFLAMAILLVWVWDRRPAGEGAPRPPLRATLVPIGIALVAVPLVVYAVSFAGRLDGRLLAAPWDRGSWAWAFLRRQAHILTFHADLRGAYPYESPAWSWPLLKRPVVFALEVSGGRFREILAIGNPVVWWLGILAVLGCAGRWIRRGRGGPEGVILAGVAAGYLWWLPVTSSRSFSFLFYLLPALPFVCLAIARIAQRVWQTAPGRGLVAVAAAAALAAFVFFLPVLAFRPLDAGAWTSRLWFTDCRPEALVGDPPRPQSETVTEPPDGWCWI